MHMISLNLCSLQDQDRLRDILFQVAVTQYTVYTPLLPGMYSENSSISQLF